MRILPWCLHLPLLTTAQPTPPHHQEVQLNTEAFALFEMLPHYAPHVPVNCNIELEIFNFNSNIEFTSVSGPFHIHWEYSDRKTNWLVLMILIQLKTLCNIEYVGKLSLILRVFWSKCMSWPIVARCFYQGPWKYVTWSERYYERTDSWVRPRTCFNETNFPYRIEKVALNIIGENTCVTN
jgi:hypothetical protein